MSRFNRDDGPIPRPFHGRISCNSRAQHGGSTTEIVVNSKNAKRLNECMSPASNCVSALLIEGGEWQRSQMQCTADKRHGSVMRYIHEALTQLWTLQLAYCERHAYSLIDDGTLMHWPPQRTLGLWNSSYSGVDAESHHLVINRRDGPKQPQRPVDIIIQKRPKHVLTDPT